MVETLQWINDNFIAFIGILGVLLYFFYGLVCIWRDS